MIKIEIEINQLKKFANNVDIKEPEQLQRVAKQFISAINVDNNKNVTIDSSKLNPEVLKITGG